MLLPPSNTTATAAIECHVYRPPLPQLLSIATVKRQHLGCLFLFSGIYFLDAKKTFLPGFLRISFFPCVFWRNFSQERGLQDFHFFLILQDFFAGIPVGQEFLYLPRIPPDSKGFLFPPKAAGSGQRLKKALC